ncbi:hypothetical protein ACFV1D_01155, partial [Streptomyces mirabilis]
MRALTGGAVSGLERAMQIRAGPVGDGSNKAAWTGPWASRGAQGQPVADGQVGACAAAAEQGVFGVGEGVGRTGGLGGGSTVPPDSGSKLYTSSTSRAVSGCSHPPRTDHARADSSPSGVVGGAGSAPGRPGGDGDGSVSQEEGAAGWAT